MRKERPDEWKRWETRQQRRRRDQEEDYLLFAIALIVSVLSVCHMFGIWR